MEERKDNHVPVADNGGDDDSDESSELEFEARPAVPADASTGPSLLGLGRDVLSVIARHLGAGDRFSLALCCHMVCKRLHDAGLLRGCHAEERFRSRLPPRVTLKSVNYSALLREQYSVSLPAVWVRSLPVTPRVVIVLPVAGEPMGLCRFGHEWAASPQIICRKCRLLRAEHDPVCVVAPEHEAGYWLASVLRRRGYLVRFAMFDAAQGHAEAAALVTRFATCASAQARRQHRADPVGTVRAGGALLMEDGECTPLAAHLALALSITDADTIIDTVYPHAHPSVVRRALGLQGPPVSTFFFSGDECRRQAQCLHAGVRADYLPIKTAVDSRHPLKQIHPGMPILNASGAVEAGAAWASAVVSVPAGAPADAPPAYPVVEYPHDNVHAAPPPSPDELMIMFPPSGMLPVGRPLALALLRARRALVVWRLQLMSHSCVRGESLKRLLRLVSSRFDATVAVPLRQAGDPRGMDLLVKALFVQTARMAVEFERDFCWSPLARTQGTLKEEGIK